MPDYFCQISKKYIFGVPQNFCNEFMCAMRRKGEKIIVLEWLKSSWLLVGASSFTADVGAGCVSSFGQGSVTRMLRIFQGPRPSPLAHSYGADISRSARRNTLPKVLISLIKL